MRHGKVKYWLNWLAFDTYYVFIKVFLMLKPFYTGELLSFNSRLLVSSRRIKKLHAEYFSLS